MDQNQLRCFLAIAELGSVSRAAARLDIAQPSLSQILLRLEDELGTKLFERTSRGVSPTEAGRIFQEHARNLLAAMQRAREEVHRRDAFAHATVAVGLPSSISMLLGVRLVIAAREQLKNVSIHLDEAMSGHIREWLERGSIEIGILHHINALRHLSIRRLAVEELFLIGPPRRFGPSQHGIAQGQIPVPITELRQLILPSRQHGLRQFVDDEAQAQGIELNPDIVLSHAAVRDDLMAGHLSAIRMTWPVFRRTIYLVRNPSHVVTSASVRVEDLMVSMMREMVANGTWLAEWAGPEMPADQP
jgi:LysR family nitrogen assimilation transcriptional regulator